MYSIQLSQFMMNFVELEKENIDNIDNKIEEETKEIKKNNKAKYKNNRIRISRSRRK